MGKRLTNEEFVERLKNKNPYIIPRSEYKNRRTKMCFGCLKNESHEDWWTFPGTILYGDTGCPACGLENTAKAVSKMRMDITTKINETDHKIKDYLHNKSDGDIYGCHSNAKTDFECPICHTVFKKIITNVAYCLENNNYFPCPVCSSGKKYPNNFMFAILKELKIDFINEYKPEWSLGKIYDFYFILNKQKYIIEMDGGFHNRDNKMLHMSYEEIKSIDDLKDKLAEEHNIKVIRIDCDYKTNNRFEYIKENIIKNLSSIFDLSYVDFELCDMKANKSKLLIFAESWERYHNVLEVAKDVGYNKDSTIKYLKMTEKYKLSSFRYEEYKNSKKKYKNSVTIRCIETNEIFDTITQGELKYHCDISGYLKNRSKYAGKLPDGTKLHWELVETK